MKYFNKNKGSITKLSEISANKNKFSLAPINYKKALTLFMSFNILSFSFLNNSFGNSLTSGYRSNYTTEFKILDPLLKPESDDLNSIKNNYCIAIRGNGELMPSHWGALAKTLELFQIPKGMGGGSSGSISSFLMESFLENPLIKEQTTTNNNATGNVKKALQVALMFKSLEGLVDITTKSEKIQDLSKALNLSKMFESRRVFLKKATDLLNEYDGVKGLFKFLEKANNIIDVFDELKNSKVFYGPAVKDTYEKLLEIFDLQKKNDSNFITNYQNKISNLDTSIQKLKESLKVFGSFNAKDDAALFYRSGVVNFEALANFFGFIADFYSLTSANNDTKAHFRSFLDTCSDISMGQTWQEIIKNSSCNDKLKLSLDSYLIDLAPSSNNEDPSAFSFKDFQSERLKMNIGSVLPVMISTAIVEEQKDVNSITRAIEEYNSKNWSEISNVNYKKTLMSLPISSSSSIKYGYWGESSDLTKINLTISNYTTGSNGFSANTGASFQDKILSMDKTKRFYPIGTATWKTALSLSPAEPGLSSILKFKDEKGKELYSLGGWSDLSPSPILKIMGCKNVVYVTRDGGDSLFAQGIAKRLSVFKNNSISWSDIDPRPHHGNLSEYYNYAGYTTSESTGTKSQDEDQSKSAEIDWNQLYNLINPDSVVNLSLKAADVVICTHWNSFSLDKQFHEMIEDAYNTPIFVSRKVTLKSDLKSKNIYSYNDINKIQEKHSLNIGNKSYMVPKYSGCVSYPEFSK